MSNILKKIIVTTAGFILLAALVFAAGAATAPTEVALPQRINSATECPVTSCTQPNGACHAAAVPPDIDGSFTMACPEAKGCRSTECHAYSSLVSHYNKPKDASLNLWIVTPVIVVVGLVLLVLKVR